jgi:internalin A
MERLYETLKSRLQPGSYEAGQLVGVEAKPGSSARQQALKGALAEHLVENPELVTELQIRVAEARRANSKVQVVSSGTGHGSQVRLSRDEVIGDDSARGAQAGRTLRGGGDIAVGDVVGRDKVQVTYDSIDVSPATTRRRRPPPTVPSLPSAFIARPDLLAAAKEALLAPSSERAARMVALVGMGGSGKSTLANALARDPDIAVAFIDGVVRLELGPNPDLVAQQARLAALLGDPRPILNVEQGTARLNDLLAEANLLLLLDNVWDYDDLRAFRVLEPRCALLVTTRNRDALDITAVTVAVDVLSHDQALELLAARAGIGDPATLPPEASEIIRECGGLPLALAIAGGMVADGRSWRNVLERLRRADLDKLQVRFSDYPYPDLLRALGVSIEALSPDSRSNLLSLVVFEDRDLIPVHVVARWWQQAGMDELDSEDLLDQLARRSLIQYDPNTYTIALPQLLFSYARRELGTIRIQELADRLSNNYSAIWGVVDEPHTALYEAKLLLVGEGNVGKTSLVAALRGAPFIQGRPLTHGIELGQLRIQHPRLPNDILLNTWDFGGQEIYRITHQFFFSQRCLYLLVLRLREGREEGLVEAWCKRIRMRIGQQARILVVSTHADEDPPAQLDLPRLQREFANVLVDHVAIDSKSGRGIDELRRRIADQAALLPKMGEPVGRHWLAARDEIRRSPEPQISYTEFAGVCQEHGLDHEEAAELAALLHDLGQVVHHADDDSLYDVVVLQPEWVTKAIAYVLDDGKTEADGGFLDHHRLKEIWEDRRRAQYPRAYYPYFLRLMEKFDISYRIPEENKSLIAQLVRHSQPELPWEPGSAISSGVRELSLICQTVDPVPALIAWLTVRNHRFSTGGHWRRGVFLEHRDHDAQAIFYMPQEREIALIVRGPSPDYFFSILRDSLEDLIYRRFHGLKVDLFVPCHRALPNGGRCNGRFRLSTLRRYREVGRATIDCHEFECLGTRSVQELLTGFAPPETPVSQVFTELREQFIEDNTKEHLVTRRQMAEIAQQVRVVLHAVSTELADCPRLFTLLPDESSGRMPSKVLKDHYQLTLWCEQPGEEHPWAAARYRITRPKEWVATLAPYALGINKLLRVAVPVGAAIVGVALSENELKGVSHELELMKTLTESLLPEGDSKEAANVEDEGWQNSAVGAGLRALRALLSEVDPFSRFGDLRRVLAPSGDYLWVCPTRHLREYDPGLPQLPAF